MLMFAPLSQADCWQWHICYIHMADAWKQTANVQMLQVLLLQRCFLVKIDSVGCLYRTRYCMHLVGAEIDTVMYRKCTAQLNLQDDIMPASEDVTCRLYGYGSTTAAHSILHL